MPDHIFWWLLTMACVVWYSTVTVYVTIKGIADIRHMLRRLSGRSKGTGSGHDAENRT
ncbi:MAG TPA: hypothetical protein VHE81_19510 [Lacipirellulaceae bacterium]|nr:hypothetical protein [Lacipirellulaceae bacterium]